MNYKISIIIPVYNAENSLKRCVDSIINQSIGFDNIELILVDDNSKDNSREIIQDYCNVYENIVGVFLEENHGFPGFGRNIAIKKATANYIMFIDNDDEYTPEICEKLYENMISNDADLVQCNHIHKDGINTVYISIPESEKGVDSFLDGDIIQHITTLVWDKIFKRSIILENNIRFIEDAFGEDDLFVIEYCLNANKLIKLNDFYGYIYYGGHLSDFSLKLVLDKINVSYLTNNLFKKYSVSFNISNYFNSGINMVIGMAILVEDIKLKDISDILIKLYSFEKEINFENKYLEVPFIRFINSFILKNRLTISKYIIYILNRVAKLSIFRKIYRKNYS